MIARKLTASDAPEPAELRTGSGIIQLEYNAIPGALAAGPHTLVIQNQHLSHPSVYLLNAARPVSASIQINAQKRNGNQSIASIDFAFHPPAHPLPSVKTSRVPLAILLTCTALALACWAWKSPRRRDRRVSI